MLLPKSGDILPHPTPKKLFSPPPRHKYCDIKVRPKELGEINSGSPVSDLFLKDKEREVLAKKNLLNDDVIPLKPVMHVLVVFCSLLDPGDDE